MMTELTPRKFPYYNKGNVLEVGVGDCERDPFSLDVHRVISPDPKIQFLGLEDFFPDDFFPDDVFPDDYFPDDLFPSDFFPCDFSTSDVFLDDFFLW